MYQHCGKESGQIIPQLLKRMGLTPNYLGYRYLCDLPGLPAGSLKETYFILSERHRVSYACVERNIRTAIGVIWKYPDHTALDELFGHHVYSCPKCAEFMSAIATFSLQQAEPASQQSSLEPFLPTSTVSS